MSDRARLSAALYAIHRPSVFYCGTSPEGELHLLNGGSIGGDDGMPMDVGMNSYACCRACKHPTRSGAPPVDCWPCDTVKLLLEAGVIEPMGAKFRRVRSGSSDERGQG